MRAHLAAAPAAHRAPITMFVPHGHPAHRASTAHLRAVREPGGQLLPVRGGLPAALASAVCALVFLGAVLLGSVPGAQLAPASPMLPWQAAVPSAPFGGTRSGPAVPGIRAPGLPARVIPAVVLPVPHFISLPFRGRQACSPAVRASEWAYPSELFPTSVRASAVGITTAVSRIGAAIGTFGLPFALAGWGVGPTMIVAAVLTACGFLLSVLLAEETKGMSLAKAGSQAADDAAPAPAADVAAPAVRATVAD